MSDEAVYKIQFYNGVARIPERVARVRPGSSLPPEVARYYRTEVGADLPAGVLAETGFYRDNGEWCGLMHLVGEAPRRRSWLSRLMGR